jgi:hypothetical protein
VDPGKDAHGDRRHGWSDWRAGGFEGRPPWRRGFRPRLLVISLVLLDLLVGAVLLALSGRF